MEVDRRRFPRVSCDGVAELELTNRALCPAHLLDLSTEGCHLVLDSPQQIERDTVLGLTFEVDDIPFHVLAQVKSIRSGISVGFQFSSLREGDRAQLDALVERLAVANQKAAADRLPWEPVPTTH